MPREIAKTYEPKQIEPRWAEYWVKEELFKADPGKAGPVFSIGAGADVGSATAVVRNVATGNYEVYRVALACAN